MNDKDDNTSEVRRSVSATQLIQQFETKTKNPVDGTKESKNTSSPVQITTDEVPINSELALAKEDLLLNYYFGLPTVSAGDFVNSELDSLLLTQLEAETDLAKCQQYVISYLGNYTNWACLAKMHCHKTQLKVKFKIIHFLLIVVLSGTNTSFKISTSTLTIPTPNWMLNITISNIRQIQS